MSSTVHTVHPPPVERTAETVAARAPSADAEASNRRERLDPALLGDHLDRLYRAAWAMSGSREDAEDLVQETYVKVLARPRAIRRGRELAYLMRALRNTYTSRARRTRLAQISLEQAPMPTESRTSVLPQEAVEAREVVAAIGELAPRLRDVVTAVDVVGLSYQEAAAALGTRVGTVKSRLHEARRNLAAQLSHSA